MTTNLHSAELPAASLMVYVTSVTPRGKKAPGVWLRTTVNGRLSSVAVGSTHMASVPLLPLGAVADAPMGQLEMTGGVLSDGPGVTGTLSVERKDSLVKTKSLQYVNN